MELTVAQKRAMAMASARLRLQQQGTAEKPPVDAMTAATLGGGNAITLGFGDELGAALFSPLEVAIGTVNGEDEGKGLGERFGAAYDRGLEKRRDLQSRAEEEHPIATTVGAVGGGLAAGGALSKGENLVRAGLGLGEGLGGRVAASALTGGGVGAVQGFGEGEDGAGERAKRALFSSGIGAVGGAAIPAVAAGVGAGYRALKGIGKGPLPLKAQRMLENDLAAEGSSLAEAGERAKALGPQAMLADTSETLRLRAEQIAQSDNPGRPTVINAMKERSAGARDRIGSAYDQGIGETPDVQATLDKIMVDRAEAAAPLYQKALSQPAPMDENLARFVNDPIMKKGIARGFEIQRMEAVAKGEPFDPVDYRIALAGPDGEPVMQDVPNMRTLQTAKVGLDALVTDSKDQFGRLTERGRAINAFRASFLKRLDEANPDYAAARASWEGPTKTLEAFENGRTIFGNKLHPDTLKRDFGAMSEAERDAFRLGTRAAIDEAMGRVRNGALKGRQLLDSDFNERRILTVLGEDEGKKLIAVLNGEEAMAQTANQTLANSATARRQDNPFRKNGRTAGEKAPGVLRSAGNLDFGDAVAKAAEYGIEVLDRRARDGLGRSLAPTLTARGEERNALVEAMVAAQQQRQAADMQDPTRRALLEAMMRGGLLAGGPNVGR